MTTLDPLQADTLNSIDRHPRFRRMADYLAAKAPAAAKLPGRQHIDPLEITDLLPYLVLVDVVRHDGEMRFRFRLIGTEVVSRAGRDVTGAWVEEAFLPDRSGGVIDSYRCVAQTRRPHHWRITMPVAGRDHIEFERIAFPLAADGENVDMLIVIHAFFDASPEH